MDFRLGIDTGGTFTDAVSQNIKTGELKISKVPSTPKDFSIGVLNAVDTLGIPLEETSYFSYGTTVATNALIERKGAKTGLITTKGFRDILRIQRVVRRHHFDLRWVKPEHLVPRWLCTEVEERLNYKGEAIKELNEEDVKAAVEYLAEKGVKSIAVSFLFSYLNPTHERRVEELIKNLFPEAYVSLSSTVLPQWREYERTSTTVIDAYIKPIVDAYLTRLESMIRERGLRSDIFILKSSGGVMTARAAKNLPIQTIKSGPAGGIIASSYVGKVTSTDNLITIDMGGTSFDVSLIKGGVAGFTTREELEWGIPIAIPMIDCRSIGAGGGSLAWIDRTGILKVGPESAAANPGPACYGLGNTVPTVTDANVVLGRLNPEYLLGGELRIDYKLAYDAVNSMAKKIGMDVYDLARGILEVVNNNMAQAIRLVSIDKGFDPRDFSIISFGGAGPLHAVELAEALKISKVIVPVFPGAFSALGAIIGDVKFDYTQTCIIRSDRMDVNKINEVYSRMETQGFKELKEEGFDRPTRILRSVQMRYVGQNWELEVQVPNREITLEDVEEIRNKFDLEHEKQFGYRIEGEKFEFVNFKVTVVAETYAVKLPEPPVKDVEGVTGSREVYFQESKGFVDCPVYDRNLLSPYTNVKGPAVIEEVDSTILIPPNRVGEIGPYGIITIEM